MAATKHMQTFCSGSQQNLAAAKLALCSGTWQFFSGSVPYAAAVLQHLAGVTPRQCHIAAAVWRQSNLCSAAMLWHHHCLFSNHNHTNHKTCLRFAPAYVSIY
jgi:hypothetical protein